LRSARRRPQKGEREHRRPVFLVFRVIVESANTLFCSMRLCPDFDERRGAKCGQADFRCCLPAGFFAADSFAGFSPAIGISISPCPERFERPTLRFVVWSGPLKLLRFVTVRHEANPQNCANSAQSAAAKLPGRVTVDRRWRREWDSNPLSRYS